MKQTLKKILSLCLSVVFLCAVASVPTFAQERGEVQTAVCADSWDLPTQKELETRFLEKLLYGEECMPMTFATSFAERALDGVNLEMYHFLCNEVEKIALEGGSTEIHVPQDLNSAFCAQFKRNTLEEMEEAFLQQINKISTLVMQAYPENYYWIQSGYGCGVSYGYYAPPGAYYPEISYLYYKVDISYQGGNEHTVDATKIERAKTAKANAVALAEQIQAANTSEVEKLRTMKNEICARNVYNDAAAKYGSAWSATNPSDPWQIVYVFDDDPATNVVCEGYAKAFEYLCNLTLPAYGAACYCVSGQMYGSESERATEKDGTLIGNHMWNLVQIAGQSYLVDVTNCDGQGIGGKGGSGMIGADGTWINGEFHWMPGDGLFLCSCADRSAERYTAHEGAYLLRIPKRKHVAASSMYFEYDQETMDLYGMELLSLDAKTPEFVPMDTDNNGTVNLSDYQALLELVAAFNSVPTTRQLECTDLNRDGVLDAFDLSLFAKLYAEKPV